MLKTAGSNPTVYKFVFKFQKCYIGIFLKASYVVNSVMKMNTMLPPPPKEARRYLRVCTGENMCKLPGKKSTFWYSVHKELKLLQVFYLKVLLCTLLHHLTQNNVFFLRHSVLSHINISLESYNSCLYLTDVTA